MKELSDADKQQIRALLAQRLQALQPDFKAFYAWLEKNNFKVAEIRKDKVLEKVHASGLRIKIADPARLEFIVGGGPGVMVRAAAGSASRSAALHAAEDLVALTVISTRALPFAASSYV